MLICTDRQAADAAFEAKSPRPWREVVLDIYPDAVEDANGRFHAPHDGYECPITGQQFAGGQFLPMDEVDPFEAAMSAPARKFPTAKCAKTGEVLRWVGTRAQCGAVWAVLIAQTRAVEAATSQHVGEVGKMIDLTDLTIELVKGWDGLYGMTWLHIMKDAAGNVIVYKGSKRFKSDAYSAMRGREYGAGDKVSLRCKVKAHSDREGVAQTVIERPKLIEARRA